MRRRVAERVFGTRRVRRGLAQGARARRREPHGLCPPVVVVIDEWCGRSHWRPGLPAAGARDDTTRRERLSTGSVAGAHVRSAKATVLLKRWAARCNVVADYSPTVQSSGLRITPDVTLASGGKTLAITERQVQRQPARCIGVAAFQFARRAYLFQVLQPRIASKDREIAPKPSSQQVLSQAATQQTPASPQRRRR